ncbi:MAG: hypothetical protein QW403_02175 [Candidatus Aenigmatarchaeota archaeon]
MGDKYLNKSKEHVSKLLGLLASYEAQTASYIPQAQDNVVDALERKIKILREGREKAIEDLARLKIYEMFE